MTDATTPEPLCSFCREPKGENRRLIAGHDGAFICDECLGIGRLLFAAKNDPVALANLRIAAFAALKGWGETREDGKWSSWNNAELRQQAENLVAWALGSAALSSGEAA